MDNSPGRVLWKTDSSIPGPGTYSVAAKDNNQAYSLSHSNRFSNERSKNPGPGSYDPSSVVKGGCVVMDKGSRAVSAGRSLAPGPGQYDPGLHKDGPNFSFRGRAQTGVPKDSPGPGSYEMPKKQEGKIQSFGVSRQRPEKKEPQRPGPGVYNHSSTINPHGTVIGKGTRMKNAQSDSSPGPGSYKVVKTEDTPKFSFREKLPVKVKDSGVPGPGFYHNVSKKDQAYTLSKATRFNKPKSSGPGPAAYSVDEDVKHRGGNAGFGCGRPKHKEYATPGPGKYESKKLEEGKVFSVGGRYRDHKESGPGPGSYSPEIKDKTERRTVFGTGKRPNLHPKKDDTPGAGYLNLPFRNIISYSFGSSVR